MRGGEAYAPLPVPGGQSRPGRYTGRMFGLDMGGVGPEVLLYGLPLAFLAGFIDAVAGGGGTISLPALFFMGLSPVQAVATNKLLAIFGSATSTYQYWRGGHLDRDLLLRTVPLALIGSAIVLVIAALVAEQFCTLPKDPDDSEPRDRAPELGGGH